MKVKRKSKLVVIITLIVMALVGFSGWAGIHLLDNANDKSVTLADAKSNGSVRVVSNDTLFVNPDKEEEIAVEIARLHAYFNNLLGWGAWQSVDTDDKRNELERKLEYINEILLPETRGPLETDMKSAADGIQKAIETGQTEDMFITHRIFHDLDVVMNDNVAEDYWGVTATYGK